MTGILWSPNGRQWFYREQLEGRTYPAGSVYRTVGQLGRRRKITGEIASVRPRISNQPRERHAR